MSFKITFAGDDMNFEINEEYTNIDSLLEKIKKA
jgi:hypothetical protein